MDWFRKKQSSYVTSKSEQKGVIKEMKILRATKIISMAIAFPILYVFCSTVVKDYSMFDDFLIWAKETWEDSDK